MPRASRTTPTLGGGALTQTSETDWAAQFMGDDLGVDCEEAAAVYGWFEVTDADGELVAYHEEIDVDVDL